MENGEKQTTQEAIFSILFKDLDETIKKVDRFKTELPAVLHQTIEQITEKTNANFQNLNNALHAIRPQIDEALTLDTRNAEILVGRIVDASKGLQGAAENAMKGTVSTVAVNIQETIKNSIDDAVKNAFKNAFASNVTALNNEMTALNIRVAKVVEKADNVQSEYFSKVLLWSAGIALAGALLAATMMVGALRSGIITLPTPEVSLDAKEVAANITKALPAGKR